MAPKAALTLPSSDIGTLVPHWITAIATTVSLLTGIRISADALDAVVSKWMEPVLPQGEIWSVHVIAGLTLPSASTAYLIYMAMERACEPCRPAPPEAAAGRFDRQAEMDERQRAAARAALPARGRADGPSRRGVRRPRLRAGAYHRSFRLWRLAIEQDLRIALNDGTLNVLYQPMVSLDDGRVVGAEALVRWHHPTRGDIPPGKFIGVAEGARLISELGRFVLKRTVQETVALVREGAELTIAVNVSVLQLEDPTFSQTVETCLAKVGFPLDHLEIEITESIAMRASDVVRSQIAALSSLGVRFAMDDFGTGYSSLSMLAPRLLAALRLCHTLRRGRIGKCGRPA